MTVRQRHGLLLAISVLGLMVSACGHYKTDFSCKGYPESGLCLSTIDTYNRRHEQLTKMKKDEDSEGARPTGESAVNRVAAIAGQTEMHLGQPNITPPQVMQVWIAPWRDKNNFLHEASIVYAIVQQSDWTYGRPLKGGDKGGTGKVFAPRMTPGLVEPPYARTNNGSRPVMTNPPATSTPPPGPTSAVPGASQDPSAILRQLQGQLPSMSGQVPAPYGGPPAMDPDTAPERLQERMQEQRERMFQ